MLITIFVFLVTLLVLVVSHELGHFLMARRYGVRVLEFGFGLPPRLWKKKIGETTYSLNLLPIGGFVRLLGEDEGGAPGLAFPANEQSGNFTHQNVWKRIVMVAAGVVVNLLLALVLFYTVLVFQNWRIIYPTAEPVAVVADLQAGFPAQMAGIKVGERVLSVDGVEVTGVDEAVRLIRAKPGVQLKLELSDVEGLEERVVELTPKTIENGEGRIGVAFSPIPFKSYNSLLERIFSAPMYAFDLTRLTFQGLGRLVGDLVGGNFTRASQSVSGPVGLVGVTNDIVSSGWQATLPYLWFMGVISLTLTIFNSLPLPALDGGRILFMLIELVTKKKVNPSIERLVHTAGMVILLGLMALITLSDIRKLLPV